MACSTQIFTQSDRSKAAERRQKTSKELFLQVSQLEVYYISTQCQFAALNYIVNPIFAISTAPCRGLRPLHPRPVSYPSASLFIQLPPRPSPLPIEVSATQASLLRSRRSLDKIKFDILSPNTFTLAHTSNLFNLSPRISLP